MAVLRSSPTERVRERNRERVALRFGVRSDVWDGFSDGMFATDRDGITLVVQNLRAWTVDIWARAERRRTPASNPFPDSEAGVLVFERLTGIEPASPPWEGGMRTIAPQAHCGRSRPAPWPFTAFRPRCRSPRTTGRRSACRQPPFLDVFEVVGVSAGVDAGTPRWHPPVLDGRGPPAKAAGAGMAPRLSAAFFVHTGCMRPGG